MIPLGVPPIRRLRGSAALLISGATLGIGLGCLLFLTWWTAQLKAQHQVMADPERTAAIQAFSPSLGTWFPATFEDFQRLRSSPRWNGLAYSRTRTGVSAATPSSTSLLPVAAIAGDVSRIAPPRLLEGRFLVPEDRGALLVATRQSLRPFLHAGTSAVGQVVSLNGRPFTLIGVVADGYAGLDPDHPAEAWVPVDQADALDGEFGLNERTAPAERYGNAAVFLRRSPGNSLAQARGEVLRQLGPTGPDWHYDLLPWPKLLDAATSRTVPGLTLLTWLGLTLFLLCLVTAAGLLAMRTLAQGPNLRIRCVLGATLPVLLRDVAVETLAAAGMALGTAILTHALLALGFQAGDTRWPSWGLWLLLVMGAWILLFLLQGALVASDYFRGTFEAGGLRDSSLVRLPRLRLVLLSTQIALCALGLYVGAGLLRQFLTESRTSLGMDLRGVWALEIPAPPAEAVSGLRASLLNQTGGHHLALADLRPLGGRTSTSNYGLRFQDPSPVYLSTLYGDANLPAVLGMHLAEGRFLREGERGAALVTQDLAARLWPNKNPVGQTLFAGLMTPLQVVGVLKPLRYFQPSAPPSELVIRPIEANTSASTWQVLLAAGTKGPELPDGVLQLQGGRFAAHPVSLAAVRDRQLAPLRTAMLAALLVGGAGLLASSLSTYALLAQTIAARRKEIAIRLSLGAPTGALSWLIGQELLQAASLGLCLGAGMALVYLRFAHVGYLAHLDTDAGLALSTGGSIIGILGFLLLHWTFQIRRTDLLQALKGD